MEKRRFSSPSYRFLRRLAPASALALTALLAGCGDDTGGSGGTGGTGGTGTTGGTGGSGGTGGTGGGVSCAVTVAPSADDQTAVQTALIEAKDGDVVCFGEGTFTFKTELELDAKNVTLHGAGAAKTTWDFSGQDVGGNGLLIKSDGVVVEDMTVKNTTGDGIRADNVTGITFRNMSVIWDADASLESGAYGLYPVGCTDVLIDTCIVKGARDAGIYVGQSSKILIKDSEAYGNVAGIEVENSTDAEVVNNHVHDNTAGILVFNLPNLPVQDGKRAKIHGNKVEKNNQLNFGVAGTTVAKVPEGIGIMVLASDDNEVHDNDVASNNSVGVLVVNYIEELFGMPNDPTYDKFPEGNFIHDNTFTGNGTKPNILIAGASGGIDPIPDIVWDGCVNPAAVDDGHLVNCLSNNKNGAADATFANADLCGNPAMVSTDASKVTCEYDPLPPQN